MRHPKSERKNSKETNDDQACCRNFLRRRVRNSDVRRKRRRSEKLLFRRRFNRSFGLHAMMGVRRRPRRPMYSLQPKTISATRPSVEKRVAAEDLRKWVSVNLMQF